MLSKFSNSRTLNDNIKLGVITAFTAGMVNIASVMIFFAFTSNVTGHYAILAAEIVHGNYFQVAVVMTWIFLFFIGSFTSNAIVINFNSKHPYLAHSAPIIIEILCLLTVGIYGKYFYTETLTETEFLLALMLFAMGLQNGLTASISNFAVKTTHLTGSTTELGILFSMFTKKEFRENTELRGKAKLLLSITIAYLSGAVFAGFTYLRIGFNMFYLICFCLVFVIFYDISKLGLSRFISSSKTKKYHFPVSEYQNQEEPEKKERESEVATSYT